MIRKILKTSALTIALLGCTQMGFAQNQISSSNSDSKLSVELLLGASSPNLDFRLTNVEIGNEFVSNIVPEAKTGFNAGLRANYNFWNNVSVYGQFGYANIGTEIPGNIQSIIDPLLLVLTLAAGEELPIDPASIRVNLKQDGDYNLMSSNFGVRYDYTFNNKYNVGAYAGIGHYQLKTPGLQFDLSGDIDLFGSAVTIPLNNILEMERNTQSEIGWQAGVNLTYQINDKFYTGVNIEYNYAEFEFSDMEIQFNSESIPSLLAGFLPVDLTDVVPNIPMASNIDLSTMNYGIVLGMRL